MKGSSMTDPSPSVPPPAKKKLGPLGWSLIGCGGLILIAGLLIAGLMAAGDFHRRLAKRWQEEQRRQQRQEQTSPQSGQPQH